MFIEDQEIRDAYKKLELAEEYINAMERIIVKLVSKITPSEYPVELFDPDIRIINSYYTFARDELKESKEKLVRKDFALRDIGNMIVDRDSLSDIVSGMK